jgi:DDE superfamily endonuclease
MTSTASSKPTRRPESVCSRGHLVSEFADCLPFVSAGIVDRRQEAEEGRRHSGGNAVSDQATDRSGTDQESRRRRGGAGRSGRRCWLWRGRRFRAGITELGLEYTVGVQSSLTVWAPGTEPLPPSPRKQTGRPPSLRRRDKDHQPVSAKQLASDVSTKEWKTVNWRQGTEQKLRSRFAAVRVRPAHRDYWQSAPHAEEWLLVEWPKGEAEHAKYWLSTLPADTKLKDLVAIAKQRWIIERDYEELKQELGLGHYEGRGWRGFHRRGAVAARVIWVKSL